MWVRFSGTEGPELLDVSGCHLRIHRHPGDPDAVIDPLVTWSLVATHLGSGRQVTLMRSADYVLLENAMVWLGTKAQAKTIAVLEELR